MLIISTLLLETLAAKSSIVLTQIQAGNTIIDVGCGAGHLLTHLAKAVGDSGTIYGLDPSKAQLDQARKRCSEFENINFYCTTKECLSFSNHDTEIDTNRIFKSSLKEYIRKKKTHILMTTMQLYFWFALEIL